MLCHPSTSDDNRRNLSPTEASAAIGYVQRSNDEGHRAQDPASAGLACILNVNSWHQRWIGIQERRDDQMLEEGDENQDYEIRTENALVALMKMATSTEIDTMNGCSLEGNHNDERTSAPKACRTCLHEAKSIPVIHSALCAPCLVQVLRRMV